MSESWPGVGSYGSEPVPEGRSPLLGCSLQPKPQALDEWPGFLPSALLAVPGPLPTTYSLRSLKPPTPQNLKERVRSFDHFYDNSSIFCNIHLMLKC